MNATTAFRTTARLTATTAAVATMTVALAGTSFAGGDDFLAPDDTHDLPAHHLFLDGAVTGTLDASRASCAKLAGTTWSWSVSGTVDGVPVLITFDTNGYQGGGNYATTGITDDSGGLATLVIGDGGEEIAVVSNNETVGTFSIDDSQPTGSIDTTLENGPYDQQVSISGGWTCA